MKDLHPSQLGDVAEHAGLLAGIFQHKGNALKAVHIRKADKALLALEAFFTPALTVACTTWRRGLDAQRVLEDRLAATAVHAERMEALGMRLQEKEKAVEKWMSLSEQERNKIIVHARKAKHYFDSHTLQSESHILHRYERYQALKALVPFADNAHFLCEAIHHFENRDKYEDNKARLEKRREGARVRLSSVSRGFWLAMVFCVFLVTIPLCAPFAWSLYRRKREVENQLANLEETLRREDKRIQAADEGVIAAQEIREVLGPVPLEEVRSTLGEVSELRREFQASSSTSVTATLIAFLEFSDGRLATVFGPLPSSTLDRFRWLTFKVEESVFAESEKVRLAQEMKAAQDRLRRFLGGYTVGMVRTSLESVRKVTQETMPFVADEWVMRDFAALAARMPKLLEGARRALWHISHGQSIDEGDWKRMRVALASESNLLNACALELRLGAFPFEFDTHESIGEKHASLAVV
jgi:hypothetical protein